MNKIIIWFLSISSSLLFSSTIFAADLTGDVTCPMPGALHTFPERDVVYGRGTQAGFPGWIPTPMFMLNIAMIASPAESDLRQCTNASVDYTNDGRIACTYQCQNITFTIYAPNIGEKATQKVIHGTNEIILTFTENNSSKLK